LKADELWNLDYSGTDGYSDTLTITGTISTEAGTSPFTIDAVNLTYTQDGVPGAPIIDISDTSTALQTTFDSPDNLLSSTSPYLDSSGLGFYLASGGGGGDFNGNDVIYFDNDPSDSTYGEYCVPGFDEPSFCGTLSVAPATASATPEPASLGLLGLGLLALPAAMFFDSAVGRAGCAGRG
jgi:hypothetical protein